MPTCEHCDREWNNQASANTCCTDNTWDNDD